MGNLEREERGKLCSAYFELSSVTAILVDMGLATVLIPIIYFHFFVLKTTNLFAFYRDKFMSLTIMHYYRIE